MLKTKNVIKPMMLACSAGLLLTACATYEDDDAYAETSMETSTSINESSGAQQGWQAGSSSGSQDYSSSQQSSSQRQYSAQSGSQQIHSGNDLVIPLHEEQVNVGKRTVDAGTVTIRKVVTTETVNQPVQLRKETLVIDREGGQSTQFQGSASTQRQSQQTSSFSQTEENDADIDADVSAQASTSGAQAQAEFDTAEPAGAQQQRSSSQHKQSTSSSTDGAAFQEQTYTIQLREEQPVVEKSVVQTGQVVARKNSQTQRQNVQREVRREDVRIDQGANARNVEIRGDFDSAGTISDPSGAQRSTTTTYQSETEVESDVDVDVDADRIGVEGDAEFEDSKTLDDINQGSNTRGGAEDLQRFDEKANRNP